MRFFLFSLLSCWLFLPLHGQDPVAIPPTILICGDGNQGYGLYWKDNSINETKFRVYSAINNFSDFSLLSEVKSNSQATTGTDYYCKIESVPENFYSYRVDALNKAGKSSSSELIVLPKRPAGFAIKTDSISAILTWTYPVDNLVNFVFVERSNNPDKEFQIMSPVVNQGGVTYVDYSADRGVDYYYRIRGVSYDSRTKITSYTTPTETIGPVRVPGSDSDHDGLVNFQGHDYKYKTFVNQTWMIENLAYLPEVNPAASTSSSDKRYYIYGFNGSDVTEAKKTENYKIYGAMYNWTAASEGVQSSSTDPIGVQGICPTGWHLPSNKEWVDLWENLTKVKAKRDSAILADAVAKGAKVYDNRQFIGDFAMPGFNQFRNTQGGFLLNDSIKFHSAGEVENYWSSTSRILVDKGIRVSDAGKESGFPVRCIKGPALPLVSTEEAIDITETAAKLCGTIPSDGGAPVLSRGICWNTIGMPALSDNNATNGTGTGAYNCPVIGLKAGTIYFTRAFATNSAGTTYGAQKQFKTTGKAALATVLTVKVGDILGTSASANGNITALGGDSVSIRGVCWNTKKKPTIANSVVIDRSGKLNFVCYAAGLTPLTTYYLRAFATNSSGTAYGEEQQFTTGAATVDGSFDYKGRTYTYTTIGTQTWMSENLAWLPTVSSFTVGSNDKPFYYVYGYEGSNVDSAKATENYKKYGVLYNWKAATTACPTGWHLPGQEEMNIFTDYLTNYGYGRGGYGNRIAKSLASTTGWERSIYPGTVGNEPGTNNQSGFNAIPGGQCYSLPVGVSTNIGKGSIFWSATENLRDPVYGFSLVLFYSRDIATPYPNADKKNGFSVRCLKDK
jgi:uncharacterized protein (TIGR02145 family)